MLFRTLYKLSYKRFIVTQIVFRFRTVGQKLATLRRLVGRRRQAAHRLCAIAVAVVGGVVRIGEVVLIDRDNGEVVQLVRVHAAQRVVATGQREERLLQFGSELFAENRVDYEIRRRVKADEHIGDGR